MTYQPIFSMPQQDVMLEDVAVDLWVQICFYKKCKERKKKQDPRTESMGGLLKLAGSPPQDDGTSAVRD